MDRSIPWRALAFALLTAPGCGGGTPHDGTLPPASSVEDGDADGVADDRDRCPRDAEDVDAYLDDDGCPDPDDDGDGVVDACDACPRHAGPRDGCPAPSEPREAEVDVVRTVTFEPGASALTPESLTTLLALARALRVAVELERIVVVGLARDDEPAPETLVQARAERVRTFLVAHGVDGARLVARGFTEDPLPTSPPWPPRAERDRASAWLVVEVAAGRVRYALEHGAFVAVDREAAETTTTPRRAPCPSPRP